MTASLAIGGTGGGGTIANDAFIDADPLGTLPVQRTVVNTGAAASEQGGRAVCAAIDKTVWYRYTPTTNSACRPDTSGSGFDTVLAVHRGSTPTRSPRSRATTTSPAGSRPRLARRVRRPGRPDLPPPGRWIQGQRRRRGVRRADANVNRMAVPPVNDDFADGLR